MTRKLTLAQYVETDVTPDVLSLEEDIHEGISSGKVIVATSYASVDFAMRGWMKAGRSYLPEPQIGDTIRGFSVGTVVESQHPNVSPGDCVTGFLGLRESVLVDGDDLAKLDKNVASPARWAGNLGLTTAVTAHLGLTHLGEPKAGETILVSGASGAVGSIVGQIARNLGCRAVGFAGGPEGCAKVIQAYGFDDCIDYRAPDLPAEIQRACPDRVDVYFDNVGGPLLDAALANMKPFGRVVMCGLTADRAGGPAYGLQNFRSILVDRVTVRGFILFDHADHYQSAINDIADWYANGKLVVAEEDIRKGGLDAFGASLSDLLAGRNSGKMVLAF